CWSILATTESKSIDPLRRPTTPGRVDSEGSRAGAVAARPGRRARRAPPLATAVFCKFHNLVKLTKIRYRGAVASSASSTREPAVVSRLVERFAAVLTETGFPRMPARLFCGAALRRFRNDELDGTGRAAANQPGGGFRGGPLSRAGQPAQPRAPARL